jgi:hypothetical protein
MVRGRVTILWLSLNLMSDLYSQSFCTVHSGLCTTNYFHNNTRERLRPRDFQDFRSGTCSGPGFEKVVVGDLTASNTNTCTRLALACLPLMQIKNFTIAALITSDFHLDRWQVLASAWATQVIRSLF